MHIGGQSVNWAASTQVLIGGQSVNDFWYGGGERVWGRGEGWGVRKGEKRGEGGRGL